MTARDERSEFLDVSERGVWRPASRRERSERPRVSASSDAAFEGER